MSEPSKDDFEPLLTRLLAEGRTKGLDDQQLGEMLGQALVGASVQVAPSLVAALERDARRMLAEHRNHRKRFEHHIVNIWGEALDRYYATYVACLEAGELHNVELRHRIENDSDFTLEALTRIHGRACLVASEIFALLRTGHPSAAEARWRTLHELSVISSVIGSSDQHVAERYLLHDVIQSAKDAHELVRVQDRLNIEPLDQESMSAMDRARDTLIDRFGKDYVEDWGWVNPLFTHTRVTFRQIEELVGLDHLRPYYRLGSHHVHADAKGTNLGVGEFRGVQQMLCGPTNTGFVEVGHGALISLVNTTITLLNVRIDENPTMLMVMTALPNMSDLAGDAFQAAQQLLDQQELDRTSAEAGGFLPIVSYNFGFRRQQAWKNWKRIYSSFSWRLNPILGRINRLRRTIP